MKRSLEEEFIPRFDFTRWIHENPSEMGVAYELIKYMDPISLYYLSQTENKEVEAFFVKQNVWKRYYVDRYGSDGKWNQPGVNWLWEFFSKYLVELGGTVKFEGIDYTTFSIQGNRFTWGTRGNPSPIVTKLNRLKYPIGSYSSSMVIQSGKVEKALYILFENGLRLMETGNTYKDFRVTDWEDGISCEVCQTKPAQFRDRNTNRVFCSYDCAQK